MRLFITFIFISIGCCFVVSDPLASEGYRHRTESSGEWRDDENAGDTFDRRFENLRTPLVNKLNVYNMPQETDNPIYRQGTNKNTENSEFQESRKQTSLLEQNKSYRKERNQKDILNLGNDHSMLLANPIRNGNVPSNRIKSPILGENSENSNNFKSLYSGTQFKLANNKGASAFFNSEEQAKSGRLIQNNSAKLGHNIYNNPRDLLGNENDETHLDLSPKISFNSKFSSPTLLESDDVFDSKNNGQDKLISNIQSTFPQVLANNRQVVTSTSDYNKAEKRNVYEDSRLFLNQEDPIKKYHAIRKMGLLNQELQQEQNAKNEYRKFRRVESPITDQESLLSGDEYSSKNEYSRSYKQNSQSKVINSPKKSKPIPLDITKYDNTDYDFATQEEFLSKSTLQNNKNSDNVFNTNSKFMTPKTVSIQLYPKSDLSTVNTKFDSSRELLREVRKFRDDLSESNSKSLDLKKTSDLLKNNAFISDMNLHNINLNFNTDRSNIDKDISILEDNESFNTESSITESNPRENIRGLDKKIILEVPITTSADRNFSNVEFDTPNNFYSDVPESSNERNKNIFIYQGDDSETPFNIEYNNEYLKTTQNDKISSKHDEQITLNNSSSKKYEMNHTRHGFEVSKDDHPLVNNLKPKLILDKTPSKVVTTFTTGEDLKQILNNVNIQEHLKAFNTKYIIVFPNETVKYVDEIDSITAKFQKHVLIKSGNIITGQEGIDLKIKNDTINVSAAKSPLMVNNDLQHKLYKYKNDNNSQGKESDHIVEHLPQIYYKEVEKSQKHIPIMFNNANERRTVKLNENVPLTVDSFELNDETDTNYNIGDETLITEILKGNDENIEKETVKTTSLTNDERNDGQESHSEKESSQHEITKDISRVIPNLKFSKEQVTIDVPVDDFSNHRKTMTSNIEIKNKQLGKFRNQQVLTNRTKEASNTSSEFDIKKQTFNETMTSKDIISEKTQTNKRSSKRTAEGANISKIDDVSIYDKKFSTNRTINSTNNSTTNVIDSEGGIVSLFSALFNFFTNLESPKDASVDGENSEGIPKRRTTHKSKGLPPMECLSCAMAHGYNFQSSSENDSMEAANEPKVNNLLNYKAGDTQKREHLHGKRSKHKNSADEYSNKHKSTQLTNQNHTSTLNAQDTQGTGYVRNGGLHKLNSGFNLDDHGIVTLSPIEVPQPTIDDSLLRDKGPVHNRSLRVRKTNHNSDGGDSQDVENLYLTDQQGTRNKHEIDVSRIMTKSKPLVWYRGNGDKSENTEEEKSKPNVIYMFQIETQPIVERDTKTFIFPNGTMIKEFTETTYKNKEDKEPIIFRTTKIIHPDQPSDGYPF